MLLFCFQNGERGSLCLLDTRRLVVAEKWTWKGRISDEVGVSFILCVSGKKILWRGCCGCVSRYVTQRRWPWWKILLTTSKVTVLMLESQFFLYITAIFLSHRSEFSYFNTINSGETGCYSAICTFTRHKTCWEATHIRSLFILLKSNFSSVVSKVSVEYCALPY